MEIATGFVPRAETSPSPRWRSISFSWNGRGQEYSQSVGCLPLMVFECVIAAAFHHLESSQRGAVASLNACMESEYAGRHCGSPFRTSAAHRRIEAASGFRRQGEGRSPGRNQNIFAHASGCLRSLRGKPSKTGSDQESGVELIVPGSSSRRGAASNGAGINHVGTYPRESITLPPRRPAGPSRCSPRHWPPQRPVSPTCLVFSISTCSQSTNELRLECCARGARLVDHQLLGGQRTCRPSPSTLDIAFAEVPSEARAARPRLDERLAGCAAGQVERELRGAGGSPTTPNAPRSRASPSGGIVPASKAPRPVK